MIKQRPFMTLLNFTQGSFKRLWNLEVGMYEEFDKPEDLEWCGWRVCSTQYTKYRAEVEATVYHLEYEGDFKCARMMKEGWTCRAQACAKMCRPTGNTSQGPPVESRYKRWMRELCSRSKNT